MRFHEPMSPAGLLLGGLAKKAILLPRSLSLRLLEARDGRSGLRSVYLGEGESAGYLGECYFQGQEVRSETVPIAKLHERTREAVSHGTLLFVELNRLLAPVVPRGGLLSFPWVRQRVRLHSDEYRRRRKEMEATVGRRVRKRGYTFRTTQEAKTVARFHRELYVPHMQARFQETAHLRSLESMRTAAKRGFLLQVFEGDLWVSGAVCRLRGAELTTLAFGHVPEEQSSLTRGALSATYHFLFQWAEENGIRWVDLLRSRPNRGDGVYEHKRRWGALPEQDSWLHTAIWIYPPERGRIPPMLRGHLIWHGGRLLEMGTRSGEGRDPEE